MFAAIRNRSLFSQLVVPMVVVGIIGASAIIVSAFALQNSVEALGEMYSASSERLETLQEIDKNIAHVRALSLKHLTSESAKSMDQIRSDLDSVEQRLKLSLPIVTTLHKHAHIDEHPARQQEPVVLGKLIATYLVGIDEAVLLSAEFEKEAAFDLLTQIETRHLNKIQAAMQSLMQHTIEDIAASREDLVTAANRNLQRNLAIGFLGGAMFLGVAF